MSETVRRVAISVVLSLLIMPVQAAASGECSPTVNVISPPSGIDSTRLAQSLASSYCSLSSLSEKDPWAAGFSVCFGHLAPHKDGHLAPDKEYSGTFGRPCSGERHDHAILLYYPVGGAITTEQAIILSAHELTHVFQKQLGGAYSEALADYGSQYLLHSWPISQSTGESLANKVSSCACEKTVSLSTLDPNALDGSRDECERTLIASFPQALIGSDGRRFMKFLAASSITAGATAAGIQVDSVRSQWSAPLATACTVRGKFVVGFGGGSDIIHASPEEMARAIAEDIVAPQLAYRVGERLVAEVGPARAKQLLEAAGRRGGRYAPRALATARSL